MKFQVILLLITALLTGVSFVDAPYPNELRLQHAPTVVLIVTLGISICCCRLSNVSFACLIGFLWFHILGARWIYSFVPYDDWSLLVMGQSLSEQFEWRRNHYDRLVHFASGVLLVPPIAEALQRWGSMRPAGASLMAIASVLAIGAIYEILEWQIAVTFSPAQAEAYNGQQGDIWDPQKDLALAWFGAVIAAVFVFRHDYTRAANSSTSETCH